jgi:hypothetical protein
MNKKRPPSIRELVDTLKEESANRSMQCSVKLTKLDPVEHNIFWLFDNNIDATTEVYRILPFNRLLDVYKTEQVGFRQTIKWDDPFENFLLRSSVRDPSGELLSLEEIAKKWYGQCWTLERETDAFGESIVPKKMVFALAHPWANSSRAFTITKRKMPQSAFS